MSYMSDLRHASNSARMPPAQNRIAASTISLNSFNRASTRISEALEATILVATLSGVSLVMSTVAAGAF